MKSNKRKPETVHKQTGTTHKQTETLKKGKGRGKQGGKVEPRREGEINIEQASYPALERCVPSREGAALFGAPRTPSRSLCPTGLSRQRPRDRLLHGRAGLSPGAPPPARGGFGPALGGGRAPGL